MSKSFSAAAAAAAAVLVLAVGAATSAGATTFTGSYDVTAHTDDSAGLQIGVTKLTPINLSFNLANPGDSYSRDLFKIWTPETYVNAGEDTVPQPISVNFTFTAPDSFGGSVSGSTVGESYWLYGFFNVQDGSVAWNSDGILPFNNGRLQIHLSNETFNEGLYGLDPGARHGAKVDATFTLLPSAVPEPASWALMIGGFGMAGGMLRRRRTALAATAA